MSIPHFYFYFIVTFCKYFLFASLDTVVCVAVLAHEKVPELPGAELFNAGCTLESPRELLNLSF